MITNPRAYPPWFEMPSFTYTSATIRMWDNTPGAQIYYTTDGTVPTPSSTPYIGPITIECTTTFEAMAAAVGYSDSSVASMTYEITALPTATPAFSVAAGSTRPHRRSASRTRRPARRSTTRLTGTRRPRVRRRTAGQSPSVTRQRSRRSPRRPAIRTAPSRAPLTPLRYPQLLLPPSARRPEPTRLPSR